MLALVDLHTGFAVVKCNLFCFTFRTVRPSAIPAHAMPNEPAYMNPASLYGRGGGGEINGGFIGDSQSLSGSRKSLGPLQVR